MAEISGFASDSGARVDALGNEVCISDNGSTNHYTDDITGLYDCVQVAVRSENEEIGDKKRKCRSGN